MNDLRFAVRQLIKSPGFTVAAVFTLALGLGASTTIFSVVNSVLLRPPPYPDPSRLWMMLATHQTRKVDGLISMEDYLDFKEQSNSFQQLGVFTSISRDLSGVAEPERIQMGVVSQNLLPLLGVTPFLGRTFVADEDSPSGPRVTILSYELWQRRFASKSDLIGQSISISDVNYLVVGVMPPGFRLAQTKQDAWTLTRTARGATARSYRIFSLIGRAKPGVNILAAQSELNTIAARLAQQHPESNAGFGLGIVRLQEFIVGSVRTALLILAGAVALVLLIACINVVNLLLVRVVSREKEIAIRTALGATQNRLVKQLATEGLVLAGLGGLLGFVFSIWATSAMRKILPDNLPALVPIYHDGAALIFLIGTTILLGVTFGIVPALRLAKQDFTDSLNGRGTSAGQNVHRLRTAFVISELALAVMLLAGAGLLIKSFVRLQQVDLGFEAKNLLTMEVLLPRSRYPADNQRANFFAELIGRIEKLPGVEGAAAAVQAPLIGLDVDKSTFTVRGANPARPGHEPDARLHVVTPEYIRTLKVPLRAGRMFTEHDNRDSPGVIIINETMAKQYWPNDNPIGRQLTLGLRLLPDDPAVREVVGVVGTLRHFGLAAAEEPQMYVPHGQTPWPEMTLLVRGSADAGKLAPAVRAQVRLMDKDLPVSKIQTMEQGLKDSIAQPRFRALLLGFFAGIAIALSALGLYGVMAYSVTQRTSEIGIRMALGASTGDVLSEIFREGLYIVALGLIVGLAGAFALTRLLASLLFGVGAGDPFTFAGVCVLMPLVALLASYLPARRAIRVDPAVALRSQ